MQQKYIGLELFQKHCCVKKIMSHNHNLTTNDHNNVIIEQYIQLQIVHTDRYKFRTQTHRWQVQQISGLAPLQGAVTWRILWYDPRPLSVILAESGDGGLNRFPANLQSNKQMQAPKISRRLSPRRSNSVLTLYGHIKTAKQRTIIQQYGDWYIGRWWVGCYIWYSGTAKKGLGGLRRRPVPSSLYYMLQPTHHRPMYQLHIIRCGTIIASEF